MTGDVNVDRSGAGEGGADSARERQAEVVVLGAGVSGMVSASVLLDQGATRVIVIDEYDRVGGNHLDEHVGGYTFDIGSLIFQDDSPLVERFPELMQSYIPITPSWQRLNPQGLVTEYPFSVRDDILSAGPVEWSRMALSTVRGRALLRRQHNAREFAEYWLGARFAQRTGLLRYMERLCGLPPELIDLEFARSRMGWISEHARVGKQVRNVFAARRRSTTPSAPRVNRQLVRPRAGFVELYRPVVTQLTSRGAEFSLGETLIGIEHDGDDLLVRTGTGVIRCSRVVSTIPIDRALTLIGVEHSPLPTVTLITVFYSFEGRRGFSAPILYDFANDGTWKRLTMHSDFYGPAHGREFFAVEVIDPDGEPSIDRAAQQFREHSTANGLFSGDLRIEGGSVLTNAYPIFTAGSSGRAKDAIAELRAFGIESLGRQGGFEYQPTARRATHVAERALGARKSTA